MTEPGTDWTRLCTVTLEAGGERIAAFARALGIAHDGARDDRVPATFAATILSDPRVTGPLQALAHKHGAALVHQAQEFRYHHDLENGGGYQVDLDWRRPADRADRVTIRGLVRDGSGRLCQEFRTDIVLFEARPRSGGIAP